MTLGIAGVPWPGGVIVILTRGGASRSGGKTFRACPPLHTTDGVMLQHWGQPARGDSIGSY